MKRALAGFLAVFLGLPVSGFAHGAAQSPSAPPSPVASSAADARVRGAVVLLGVGQKVRLRTASGEETRGRITSIGDDSLALDTGQQQRTVSYAEVGTINGQGLNGWVKGGIITGAVIGALTAVSAVLVSR